MPANKVAVATVLGAAGALAFGVLAPVMAVAAQPNAQPVTVTIKQNGDYTATLCAADILEGRCLDGAKKGDTKTFTVKPPKNSPNIEVRVVVNGGGSTFQNFTADGPKLDIETGGNKQNPTAVKAAAGGGHGDHGTAPTQPQPPAEQKPAPQKPVKGTPTFFSAELDGKQEVPAAGQKVGDPDGRASALVEIKGDRITFALNWKNTSPLTLGHIHQGAAGQNGPVKVPLFSTAMPDTVTAAAGQVVVDPALAEEIRKNPAGFYVNLHSTEFGGGAVRAQLKPLNKRVNPLDIIKGGKLRAFSNGKQEVPVEGGPKVGDQDGQAVTFVQPAGSGVDFSIAWVNIEAPTLGHVHQGVKGQNGPVKITFFGTPIPAGIFAVNGTVSNVDKVVVDELKKNPAGFYSNLHTLTFGGGAVRGQFHS
ncbi:CHRD domain-containing protein [Lentzea tibetensis]|uniref:CHRD domain-containing protein n=1 Tax=Lentzea tibetensis TaxID=2591470 RepID=A0A563ERM9_9PSEU|nr:CHRD domain-containing protein [Lentzea tibetensis]TWP50336.1 CHRD domain-containing protein [Lentzea tibetensis]